MDDGKLRNALMVLVMFLLAVCMLLVFHVLLLMRSKI